jgi:membrane-bound lytic murein transglycosylase D
MFGDWPLAIAAYNCGAGAMKRILKSAKTKTFWYISEHGLLRDQSVQYVPKLLAIAELASHGEDYGVALPEISSSERFADFDYVTTSGQIFIERLENELRMEKGRLQALNPALIKNCTPPDSDYVLRLPTGMELSAHIALHAINAEKDRKQLVSHTVQKGDTLYALARSYKSNVAAICAESGIQKNDILAIGKVLYIPIESAEIN